MPQKVVLAWGHDAPVGVSTISVFGSLLSLTNPFGVLDAFESGDSAFETFKGAMQAQVSKHFTDSGVNGVVVVTGPPEEGAINIYLVDPSSVTGSIVGKAFSGIDRFNREADGAAWVKITEFDSANPLNAEYDSEVVAHETGHLVGLRHIDPPGSIEIMDYDDQPGEFETFRDGVFPITEPPNSSGTAFPDSQNAYYHLKRYIDGVPHEELAAMGIQPGTWDLPGETFADLDAGFSFFAPGAPGNDITLYDVLVLKWEMAEGPDLLAEFAQITLSELAAQTFALDRTEGIGLLAASLPGGTYDVALALGNPFDEDSMILYPGTGQLQGFLQIEADNTLGFDTLAEVQLRLAIIPEPSSLLLASVMVAAATIGRRRRLCTHLL